MLFVKHDDKTNTVLTVNASGIYYQEMLTDHRPQSKRVRLGHLVLVDSEIMPDLTEWDDYAALVISHRTTTNQIFVIEDLLKDWQGDESKAESIAIKQSELQDLRERLQFDELILNDHPVKALASLTGKVIEQVGKIINSASFKHKTVKTGNQVVFTPYQTIEHFMEDQAKSLVKRFNEDLESRGIETGYLDIETAREIIAKRFDRGAAKLLAKSGITVNTSK